MRFSERDIDGTTLTCLMLESESPENETVGQVTFRVGDDRVTVIDIWVGERHRRKGFATRLVEEVERRHRGSRRLAWTPRTSDGEAFRAAYLLADAVHNRSI